MNFREIWHITGTVYREVSFQSIFSLRAGSTLPQKGRGSIEQLVKSAQINIIISKILTAVFVGTFGFITFLPLMEQTFYTGPPKDLALVGSVSAFLASVLFLIVFMGLQVTTSFVSSKIADTLSPLPLSKRDISSIIFLCFVRIFDAPLAVAAITLVTVYFLVGGSILGGLVSFAAVIATECFALTFTVGLARFFYARVTAGGGRSKLKTLMRFVFMLVWILPTLGAYLLVNFATYIVESFAVFTQSLSSFSNLVVLAYPFSYGFLVSFTTFGVNDYLVLGGSVAASIGYLFAAFFSLRWLTRTIRTIGSGGIASTQREKVKDTIIHPQIPWLGIIRKDLRIASRAPSYASLFFLPIIQTAILAVTFSSIGDAGPALSFGILTGASMMVLLLPTTMFSIEGLGSAYTRSLPLKKNTLITAKATLSTLVYAVSLVALFLVALYLGRDFTYILIFGGIYAMSIAAASMLELVILSRKYWKEGMAMGNLYSRLSTFILILLPGYVVAWIPIIAAFTAYATAPTLVEVVFPSVVMIEFLIMTIVVLREK